PDRNEEYLLYQTLLGVWPLEDMNEDDYARFVERIQAYMNKAIKEAKEHSSWISPDGEYEDAIRQFVAGVLDRSMPNAFLDDFLPFQKPVAQHGLCNSLSQVLVKMAAPGVPDCYQGTELWDFSLVDPDNRRPIDFVKRATLLADLSHDAATASNRAAFVQDLFANRADGRIKLFLTTEALRYRRDHRALFQSGEYARLNAVGEKSEHLFAFARIHDGESLVTVIPRLLTRVIPDAQTLPLGEEVWKDTWLEFPAWREGTKFRNIFTGAMLSTVTSEDRQLLPMGEIFLHNPGAWLEKVV
ncbi:MAG: malto-oligosyltrehalose synthase, partial [Nitrospirota bacterium]